MVESKQKIYVHERYKLSQDEDSYEVNLNTKGETPAGEREHLYEMVYNQGVDPAVLHTEVGSDIGFAWFNDDDELYCVELFEWVLDQYGS